MTNTRKGRISLATYTRVVGQSLTCDWFALDKCETLTQFAVVQELVAAYPNRFLSPGWAVRALLDKAMDEVIALARKSKDTQDHRLADFLELRRQHESVTAIAKEWNLSRECVSRTVGRKAISLVTERFLALTKRKVDAPLAGGSTIYEVKKHSA